MDQYGQSMVQTIAHTSAGHLLHQDRIELAVVANEVATYPEISGMVFYNANNEILAMAGGTDLRRHHTSAATLDDTITGYVALDLNAQAFAAPTPWWAWLATLAAVVLVPLSAVFAVGAVLRSQNDTRSLPIVTVPEPQRVPQESFCVVVNLYNQLALNRHHRDEAVQDALQMAQEVCAIHHGYALHVPERGVLLVLDRNTVNASDAICAAYLLQDLLLEYETSGEFRFYLTRVDCNRAPGDATRLELQDLEAFDLDDALTLAALSNNENLLICQAVFDSLASAEQPWATAFLHPLLEDLSETECAYAVNNLPEPQRALVANQAELILGFNTQTA